MNQQYIELTEKRINKLREYFEPVLFAQIEIIRREGNEPRDIQPHIGQKYDCLEYSKKPFRLLIMGEEGLDEKGFSIERRSAQILIEGSDPKRRYPYMKSITLLLQCIIRDIFGYELIEDEYFGSKTLFNHIYNYFVLSNWHITGAFLKNGKPTRTAMMDKIAVRNFIEQVKILEPSLIILLGKEIWLEDRTKKKWIGIHPNDQPIPTNELDYSIFVPSKTNQYKLPVIRFYHPSNREGKSYSINSDYFKRIISPVLTEVIGNYDKYIQPID